MFTTIYGLFARTLSLLVPVKKKSWVFGSDYGNMYREGSKYLIEYMLKNHPDYDCTYITVNPNVRKSLIMRGIPCEMNFSLKGIWKITRAEIVITTQVPADILLFYKKRNRKFIYLGHAQPYKAVYNATPKEYHIRRWGEKKGVSLLWEKLSHYLIIGYKVTESEFYTSTSDFLVKYNKMYYGKNANIKILGMPRNDALFDDKKMSSEPWIPGLDGKLVITYMPTHRDFGKGKVSPIPFLTNNDVQKWLRENDIVIVVKQHPNMEKRVDHDFQTDVIIDITRMKLDPQVVLYHSDAIISDYSSVWIDYLLLRRPILFYFYDDYLKEDTGVLFDVRDDSPGEVCYNEDELFNLIKKIKQDYETMKPSDRIIQKYHKYADGYSCDRYFKVLSDL